jgi:hypothetical protein
VSNGGGVLQLRGARKGVKRGLNQSKTHQSMALTGRGGSLAMVEASIPTRKWRASGRGGQEAFGVRWEAI